MRDEFPGIGKYRVNENTRSSAPAAHRRSRQDRERQDVRREGHRRASAGDGRRVGIVDPTGAWWGLRSSRDGKGAGFPILVLGGDHGDLPLPALGGAAVARLLTEQRVNLIADTSQLSVGERTRWFIDFANTLHRTNKGPLHLVLDEAHNFAPQGKVMDPDAGKMLHAANRLAAEGGPVASGSP
jgi:hypothetical protein